jgi:hypothetical protein
MRKARDVTDGGEQDHQHADASHEIRDLPQGFLDTLEIQLFDLSEQRLQRIEQLQILSIFREVPGSAVPKAAAKGCGKVVPLEHTV